MNRRSIAVCAVALAFLALSGKAALAQDRGRDRRPDSTRARPDSTPEADNGANAQGGHVTSDADRAVIQADLDRKARQAEQDRQARSGRPSNDQDRQTMERNRQAAERDRQAGERTRQAAAERDRQAAAERGRASNAQNNWNNRDGRGGQQRRSFNDQDRQVTRDWYAQNRRTLGRGWRQQDRLTPEMEARLRPGRQLDPELRQRMVWLPPDLSARYGPAPRGYRYAIIGGNVVMIDDGYRVQDVFNITIRF